MTAEDTPPGEPGMDPDRGDLVHEVLAEIPETHREFVAALLELPPEYEVTHGIEVRDLVVPICTGRIPPEPVWDALVALDLVRPGLGDAP